MRCEMGGVIDSGVRHHGIWLWQQFRLLLFQPLWIWCSLCNIMVYIVHDIMLVLLYIHNICETYWFVQVDALMFVSSYHVYMLCGIYMSEVVVQISVAAECYTEQRLFCHIRSCYGKGQPLWRHRQPSLWIPLWHHREPSVIIQLMTSQTVQYWMLGNHEARLREQHIEHRTLRNLLRPSPNMRQWIVILLA